MFYLTIELGVLVVKWGTNTQVIDNVDDYQDFFRSKANEFGVQVTDFYIMASSTVDFSDEYTNDPDVIALCDAIRS